MSDFFNKLKEGTNTLSKNLPQGKAGMAGAAGVGALLGSLFGGSKGVKKAAKNVAVVGGSAALAALAYKMYQNWSSGTQSSQGGYGASSSSSDNNDPFAAYNQSQAKAMLSNENGKLIIEAMVFAARADGHIDAQEQEIIMNTANQLGGNTNTLIRECLNKPLNPYYLAAKVQNREQAVDIYRLSAAAIVADNDQERHYLSDLASALGLDSLAVQQLNQEASALRLQIAQR